MLEENNKDWIAKHRKILKSDLVDNFSLLGLWDWILLMAEWKEGGTVKTGKKRSRLNKGSFSVTLKDEKIVRNSGYRVTLKNLSYLKETGRIVYSRCNSGLLITVCNWRDYQGTVENPGTHYVTREELERNSVGTREELERNSVGTGGHEIPLIPTGSIAPKKLIRKEGKNERIEEPTNYANDIFISSSMISDLEAVGMFWTDKDFGWLVSNEISFQSASISMRHFLHDLKDPDFNRFVDSKIGFFKNALKTNGSYSSEKYLKIQRERKKREKEQITNHDSEGI